MNHAAITKLEGLGWLGKVWVGWVRFTPWLARGWNQLSMTELPDVAWLVVMLYKVADKSARFSLADCITVLLVSVVKPCSND